LSGNRGGSGGIGGSGGSNGVGTARGTLKLLIEHVIIVGEFRR
jgi:hypothetical protein